MTEYKKEYPFPVLFEPQKHKNVLAEWISSKNLPQFHCAGMYMYVLYLWKCSNFRAQHHFIFPEISETEKYPHVTFFFNGGREVQFAQEHRSMVPSPKVKTYDLKPEMSCLEVAQKVCKFCVCRKAE